MALTRYELTSEGKLVEADAGQWVQFRQVSTLEARVDSLTKELADQKALTQEKADGEFAAQQRNAELEATIGTMREQLRKVLPEPVDEYKQAVAAELDRVASKIRSM